jgi:uncharacterized protein YegL
MMLLFLLITGPVLIQETLSAPVRDVELSLFHVNTTIGFRYSRTEVTALYRNPGLVANKAVFTMVLPESAFISNFSMTIKEEEFVAEVKEKEEAKRSYEEAVDSGLSAGLVRKNRRDSNTFSVDTNLEPGEKVVFTLTYEEQLERKEDQYEYVLHVDPGVVLEDFHVEININESLPLTQLVVPELLESNEIDFSEEEAESSVAEVTRDVGGSPNNARVVFAPSKEYQLEAGDQGVAGRLVVRYDVDRQGQDSEVQVIDGYFVHYFVPSNLPTLPKHLIFVLDTSGSMGGEKIQQLKDAMFTVLDDLTESDFFNMIEFNSDVRHWSREGFTGSNTEEFYPATKENKNKAIKSVLEMSAGGGTNLNDAILAGLEVAETALQRDALPRDVKSLVVFLTDGLGSTPAEVIKSNIKTRNRDLQTPVFTVAFGADTDLSLLQSIASQNNAVSQRIYEGSDAALQLEHFYAQISSPVLSNLKFEYVGGLDSSSISEAEVNTFFRGGELIVSGKLSTLDDEPPSFGVKISGLGKAGLPYHREFDICPRTSATDSHPSLQCLQPRVYPKSETQSFLQKLFAFQHIKQVLEKADIAETEGEKTELEEKATELSLENNFVTDVTSLVVVKPDQEPKVTQFDNLRQTDFPDYGSNYASYAYAAPAPFLAAAPAPILASAQGYSSNNKKPLPKNNRRPSNSSSISYGSLVPSSLFGSIVSRSGVKPVGIPTSRRKPVKATTTPSLKPLRTTTTPRRKPLRTTTTPRRKPLRTTTTPRRKPVTTTTVRPTVPSTPAASEDCSGRLVLYSKTHHRGDKLELTNSQPDLAEHQFDQKAVSALLTGGCCWELYSGTNYSGDQITVRPSGQYTSVTSLASLFRNVASVRKVQC